MVQRLLITVLVASSPFQILSIDDEPAVGQLLVAVLEGEGHRVTTCKSGAEALQRFQNAQVPFDLILTDHDMPGSHNGLAFVRILRARGYRGPIDGGRAERLVVIGYS